MCCHNPTTQSLEAAQIATDALMTTRGGQTIQVRFKSPKTGTYVIISHNHPNWLMIGDKIIAFGPEDLPRVIQDIQPALEEFSEIDKFSILSAILALGA